MVGDVVICVEFGEIVWIIQFGLVYDFIDSILFYVSCNEVFVFQQGIIFGCKLLDVEESV